MVVGLGNPGERYADTRHNVGFAVVDSLAARLGASFRKKLFRAYSIAKAEHLGHRVILVKPLAFMNNSGGAVKEALRETGCDPTDLLVVCDTLDLSPGNCRLRLRGSSGGQKGLESIIKALGTDGFMRLTVGIGRPSQKGKVIGHVLSAPRRDEADLIAEGVGRAADAVLDLIERGPAKVMNDYNRREAAASSEHRRNESS
ncbi:MAG TPA: aminoacyl-tRNA hydrolase [Spirochaetia bacterium]|nr:aminoacyl-tRNA hydrolase [Spirochaetia bacterium]